MPTKQQLRPRARPARCYWPELTRIAPCRFPSPAPHRPWSRDRPCQCRQSRRRRVYALPPCGARGRQISVSRFCFGCFGVFLTFSGAVLCFFRQGRQHLVVRPPSAIVASAHFNRRLRRPALRPAHRHFAPALQSSPYRFPPAKRLIHRHRIAGLFIPLCTVASVIDSPSVERGFHCQCSLQRGISPPDWSAHRPAIWRAFAMAAHQASA